MHELKRKACSVGNDAMGLHSENLHAMAKLESMVQIEPKHANAYSMLLLGVKCIDYRENGTCVDGGDRQCVQS